MMLLMWRNPLWLHDVVIFLFVEMGNLVTYLALTSIDVHCNGVCH